MALYGPEQLESIIHQNLSQEERKALLLDGYLQEIEKNPQFKGVVWLLRPSSSKNGSITIDFLANPLMENEEVRSIRCNDIGRVAQTLEQRNFSMEHAVKPQLSEEEEIKQIVEREEEQLAKRINQIQKAIEWLEKEEESNEDTPICPLSYEPLADGKIYITPLGRAYGPEVLSYVRQKHRDPMDQDTLINSNDLLVIDPPEKCGSAEEFKKYLASKV